MDYKYCFLICYPFSILYTFGVRYHFIVLPNRTVTYLMAVAAESLAGGLYGGLILYFVIKGIVAIIDKFRD